MGVAIGRADRGAMSSGKGAPAAGAGAAEGATALAGALPAGGALAAPFEGRRRPVPACHSLLQPRHHLLGAGRVLADEGAADEDALDGLGHVQPGAAERRVEEADAALGAP